MDDVKVSDSDECLQRTFLSPAALKAGALIAGWMEDAGLRTWIDQMGNIHGHIDGKNANEPALLIGSHVDTVIDAGMYDGSFEIVCAIAAIKALKLQGKLELLLRPVEGEKICVALQTHLNYVMLCQYPKTQPISNGSLGQADLLQNIKNSTVLEKCDQN